MAALPNPPVLSMRLTARSSLPPSPCPLPPHSLPPCLQNLKDAIMVTTAGAETLPFLASCVVLPASLAFFMLYNKLVEALPSVGGTGTGTC